MVADSHAPPPPEAGAKKDIEDGYKDKGRLPARGEIDSKMLSFYADENVERYEQFPKDYTPLELKNWYNYSIRDRPLPFVSSSPGENLKIWRDMDLEKMLDHHPTHEVHAKDLPDYHYWPSIQNELNYRPNKKINGVKVKTPAMEPYHQDQTDLPRFFRSGIPKTPLQEQDWFVPLTSEGRFDWKGNIKKNGYTASLFDKKGWDMRYLTNQGRPQTLAHVDGYRLSIQLPIWYRQAEVSIFKRIYRNMMGSRLNLVLWVGGIYCGLLINGSAGDAHWKTLNWDNEPWNYDIAFMKFHRDKGGFHGIV